MVDCITNARPVIVNSGVLKISTDLYGIRNDTFSLTLAGGELHCPTNGFRETASGNFKFFITGGALDNSSGAPISAGTGGLDEYWNGNWTFIGSQGTNSDMTFTQGGSVTLNATRQVTIQNAATTYTVPRPIVDNGNGYGLTKAGAGTLKLTGASIYGGGTTVSNGTLLVNGSITGAVTVASGTLLVNGSITGAVTVASGATLGGTGAITGSVTFNTGAFALFTNDVPLRFSGPVTLNTNVVHLALPNNLANGTYLLATNTTGGFSGDFTPVPVVDSGSTVGAYKTVITATNAVRLVVSATPTITIVPFTLTPGVRLTPYSQTLTAGGGTGPYTYTNVAGSLPSGLTLTSGGLLSGTPDTAATYNFTVQAMDALGYTGSNTYSLTILPNANSFFWTNTVSGIWSVAGNWTNDVGTLAGPGRDRGRRVTLVVTDLGGGFELAGRLSKGNPVAAFHAEGVALQLGVVAHHDAVVDGIQIHDIKRLGGGNPQAPALADGVEFNARVVA